MLQALCFVYFKVEVKTHKMLQTHRILNTYNVSETHGILKPRRASGTHRISKPHHLFETRSLVEGIVISKTRNISKPHNILETNRISKTHRILRCLCLRSCDVYFMDTKSSVGGSLASPLGRIFCCERRSPNNSPLFCVVLCKVNAQM